MTDLYEAACEIIRSQQCDAEWAWHQVLMELSQQYRQLDDAYLQARYIDIEDILQQPCAICRASGELPIRSSHDYYRRRHFPFNRLQLDAQQVRGLCLREGSESPRRDYRPPGGDRLAVQQQR
jgi:PTS hybrid protein